MRRRGTGALVALALVVVGLIAARASASPFSGTFGPTIYNNLADVNGDGAITAGDDANEFFGDASIINGGLDCDGPGGTGWNTVNEGAAGDGLINGNDDCTLLAYDGTADGTTIQVVNGSFATQDGVTIPNGTPLPHVYPDPATPANGDVGDSFFAWQAINGRVDSNGNETIDSQDCSNDLVGPIDVLSNDQMAACGFAANPLLADANGLVDVNGDNNITVADSCANNCFFGRDVVQGLVQLEGGAATPTPTPTPTPTATPTPGATPPVSGGNAVLMISDGGTHVTPSQDCRFIVTVFPASTGIVSVNYATAATNAAQIAATSGTLVFASGETAKTVVVDVLHRRRKPAAVEVTLSGASGATISDGVGRCTIKKKRRH